MISCRNVVEVLLEYSETQLPSEHRGQLERHLDVCAACAAYVESYQLTMDLAQCLPQVPVPARLLRRLRRALRRLAP